MSESELVSAILAEASSRGHRLFVNAQGFYKRKHRGKTYGVTYGVGGAGAPDLIGWTCDGHFVAIEVKVRGKRPKPHQDAWIAAAKLSCPTLRIGWADSVEGAMAVMEGGEPNTC